MSLITNDADVDILVQLNGLKIVRAIMYVLFLDTLDCFLDTRGVPRHTSVLSRHTIYMYI